MTYSEHENGKAVRILNDLYAQLSAVGMTDFIDESMEMTFREFEFEDGEVFSMALFHFVLTDFMIAVYEKALPLKRKLTRKEALEESISLLETTYRGAYKNGYDGALQDASGFTLEGIRDVLMKMKDAIKFLEKKKYLKRLAAQLIDPADWRLKCRISELLLERLKGLLPPEMSSSSPHQWADQIVDLLLVDQETTWLLANPPSPFHPST